VPFQTTVQRTTQLENKLQMIVESVQRSGHPQHHVMTTNFSGTAVVLFHTSLTSFSPSPTYLDVRFAALTVKKVQFRDEATARAS
jgi:hypothetical protein